MPEHTLGESRFVTLSDGRKLHYRSRGKGGPTVILESGMGFSGAVYGLILPEIAKQVRVVAYDRAGIGKSDRDDADRDIDRITDDLEQLLQQFEGPLILVGYSWGGAIVRRAAARQSADVRGIILLDQTDERNPEYFTYLKQQSTVIAKVFSMWFMHVIGLRFTAWRVLKDFPADCRREILWRDIAFKGIRNASAELKQIVPGLEALKEEDDLLDGIPAVVVSGTDPDLMGRDHRPPMVEAHIETAEALDEGKLVKARRSAHFTPLTQPKLVIREITTMIKKVREEESTRS